jgi:predicted PurR-regulated permease PerM
MAEVGGTTTETYHYDRMGRVFILACLAVSLWFGWKVFSSFFTAIAAAAVLDVTFYPVYRRLARALGGRRVPAAALTVLVVVLCVILPLAAIGVIFTKQALGLYALVNAKAQDGSLDQVLRLRDWDAVEGWLAAHAPWLDVQAMNLKGAFVTLLQKVSTRAVAFGTGVASNVLGTLGTFAVVLFSLFFFLLDGAAFVRWLGGLVPLSGEHKRLLTHTFVEITKSAVTGSGLVALAQGLLGGVAFWIAGLPAVLWGFVMTFTALVPVVGTALVWVPAGLILAATGRAGMGVFLLVWGAVVVSGADNVIRMFLVKGPVRMHPLLLFFSILGGIKMAGLLGVVSGPLVLAMIQTLLEIYRGEFMNGGAAAAGEGQP